MTMFRKDNIYFNFEECSFCAIVRDTLVVNGSEKLVFPIKDVSKFIQTHLKNGFFRAGNYWVRKEHVARIEWHESTIEITTKGTDEILIVPASKELRRTIHETFNPIVLSE